MSNQQISGGRTQWTERDVITLSEDERLLAIVEYQRARFPRNIQYSREAIELWLGRAIVATDFEGSVFLPSGSDLTYEGFNEALRELVRRVDVGSVTIPPGLLERYPDVRDYVPVTTR